MSIMRETCGCGASWEGGSAYVSEREKFRAAHAPCRRPQPPADALLYAIRLDDDLGPGNPPPGTIGVVKADADYLNKVDGGFGHWVTWARRGGNASHEFVSDEHVTVLGAARITFAPDGEEVDRG